MKKIVLIIFIGALLLNSVNGISLLFDRGVANAQEEWRKEFDDICAKTQDAMALTTDELKSLIDRCDKLKPLIEELEGAQKKVYLRRLSMCRDLYAFVLESKENK